MPDNLQCLKVVKSSYLLCTFSNGMELKCGSASFFPYFCGSISKYVVSIKRSDTVVRIHIDLFICSHVSVLPNGGFLIVHEAQEKQKFRLLASWTYRLTHYWSAGPTGLASFPKKKFLLLLSIGVFIDHNLKYSNVKQSSLAAFIICLKTI